MKVEGNIICTGNVIGFAGKELAGPKDLFISGNIILTGTVKLEAKQDWLDTNVAIPKHYDTVNVLLVDGSESRDYYNHRNQLWVKHKYEVTHWKVTKRD